MTTVAACLKWVDPRPTVDPLTGTVTTDARMSGASDADQAALEWALRIAEARHGSVVAVTGGPAQADAVLEIAVAAGAARVVRVDMDLDAPSDAVGEGLASVLGDAGVVVCGNWSVDRGSGSVPAFLAAQLGAAQALGLVTMAIGTDDINAVRRLDGGRRERLRVGGRAVLSVEGGSARLRRASIAAVVTAGVTAVEVVAGPRRDGGDSPVRVTPFRPRPRVAPAPPSSLSARERILALTGALSDRQPPRTLILDPPAAADAILEQLRTWAYLP